MAISVQQRGKRFQLRIQHRALPRRFWFNFDTEAEARAYGQQLTRLLDRGIVPTEFLEAAPIADRQVGDIISDYLKAAPGLTPSDSALLTSMMRYVHVRLSGLTYAWAESWVASLKSERGLTPGSIRKRVGALARVIDWHLRTTGSNNSNPLRLLPRGYSAYDARDEAQKVDVHRDRRLHPGEAERIRAQMPEDLRLLFDVIVWTGLRLREAYRLRVDQIDLAAWVIKVEGTKGARGASKPRLVPVVPELRDALAERVAGRIGRLWGFWDGDPATLDACTARLSYQFRYHFERAGISDLREHDLRHEACCRWIERRDAKGRWVFSEIEVARIMGWSSLRMMMRYASIRGEDLSARLG